MQTLAWQQLLRAIPEKLQNNLSLTTKARVEFAVQCLLRIDVEFVAIRGRLSGSQDAGRVYFIPYDQIDHIGFLGEIKEAEFHEHFVGLQMPGLASEAPAVPSLVAPVLLSPVTPSRAEEITLTPITPGVPPASRTELPIKSEVLERFRNRNGSGSGGTGKPTGG